MYNSDYLYDHLQRQHHEELLQEAAERRLARTARVVKPRSAPGWWQWLSARLRAVRVGRVHGRSTHLQSARF